MEKDEIRLVEDELVNTLVVKHADVFLNITDASYGIKLLELLLHYKNHNSLCRFLEKCVNAIVVDSGLVLRGDSTASNILGKFVEISLNEVFEKYYTGKDILGECFIVCSNAPSILRYICYLIFNACAKLNSSDNVNMIGHRAVSILIIFRYYLGVIINRNLHDKSVIVECKRIQSLASFDQDANPMIMSLIRMLISYDVGEQINFRLTNNNVVENLVTIIGFLREVVDKSHDTIRLCDLVDANIHENSSSNILKKIPSIKNIGSQIYKARPKTPRTATKSASFIDHTNEYDTDNISKEITKKIFSDIGLNMYDEIIDEHNISVIELLKLDKHGIENLGIINKEHIRKILKIVQKYNKLDITKLDKDFRLSQSQPGPFS